MALQGQVKQVKASVLPHVATGQDQVSLHSAVDAQIPGAPCAVPGEHGRITAALSRTGLGSFPAYNWEAPALAPSRDLPRDPLAENSKLAQSGSNQATHQVLSGFRHSRFFSHWNHDGIDEIFTQSSTAIKKEKIEADEATTHLDSTQLPFAHHT